MATALCVVDMLNLYAALVARAQDEGAEVIYVNDNSGDWNSSQEELAERAMRGERPDLIEPLLPPEGASFVIKARHTIFYMTPLEYLLAQIDHLVLAGQVTEQCILYSALDAYVRHLRVSVPSDGIAHIHEDLAEAALEMMERNMDAELASCADARLGE